MSYSERPPHYNNILKVVRLHSTLEPLNLLGNGDNSSCLLLTDTSLIVPYTS